MTLEAVGLKAPSEAMEGACRIVRRADVRISEGAFEGSPLMAVTLAGEGCRDMDLTKGAGTITGDEAAVDTFEFVGCLRMGFSAI